MEIAGLAALQGSEAQRFKRAVDEHWRYAQASTVASGSIEVQRILLARALLVDMITELSEEATEYGLTARKVLESPGGDQLAPMGRGRAGAARGARRTGAGRTGGVGPGSPVGRRTRPRPPRRCAAARGTGRWRTRWPSGSAVRTTSRRTGLVVVNPDLPAAPVAGLPLALGRRRPRRPTQHRRAPSGHASTRAATAFVCALELEHLDDEGGDDVEPRPRPSLLDAAGHARPSRSSSRRDYVLRTATVRATAGHVPGGAVPADRRRRSSGSDWRSWRSTPCGASRLETRPRDVTHWRCAPPPSRRPSIVFRVAHQLHGAIGFCDETALSWVSRASVPLRRLPFGTSATRAQLARSLGRQGLAGPVQRRAAPGHRPR